MALSACEASGAIAVDHATDRPGAVTGGVEEGLHYATLMCREELTAETRVLAPPSLLVGD